MKHLSSFGVRRDGVLASCTARCHVSFCFVSLYLRQRTRSLDHLKRTFAYSSNEKDPVSFIHAFDLIKRTLSLLFMSIHLT